MPTYPSGTSGLRDALRVAWERLDSLVGRALRRELPAPAMGALRASLVVLCLAGLALAILRPPAAPMGLLFPLLVTSFFEGGLTGLLLCPLMVAALALGPVGGFELALFAALCLFAVAISGVTSGKYREVFAHRESMLGRLEVAREVQRAMEPPETVRIGPLTVHTSMKVCHELGGDLVAIAPTAEGGALLLMGDVQGKGPQAALTAAFLEGAFYDYCVGGAVHPWEVLARLHHLQEGRHESRFVSALCLRWDPDGRLEIANAGHPRPLLCDSGQPRMLGGSGVVLGLAGLFELARLELRLEQPQKVLLMGDGCYEEEGISPSLERLLREPELRLAEVLDWIEGTANVLADDRTVVLLDFLPQPAR